MAGCAVSQKVLQNNRIVSLAMVIAIGVNKLGEREVLGFTFGESETGAFWLEFLRSMVQRGLKGVPLVISDAHKGLQAAIAQALSGASWQLCRVHFMRNVVANVPRGDKVLVVAALRTVFAQPNQNAARQQLGVVWDVLAKRWLKAAQILNNAEQDILAYIVFPKEHWKCIASTNGLEQLNKEVKRRTNVVGFFPDQAAAIRLIGAVLQ